MSDITLNWTDNNADGANSEDEHRVYRSNSTIDTSSPGAVHATVAANLETYQDTTVIAKENYFYRVSAYRNADSTESFSAELGPVYYPDISDDLGYPNGIPSSANTYNCTVQPKLHWDAQRHIAIATSTPLSQILDRSGNENHGSQTTSTLAHHYVTPGTGANSLPHYDSLSGNRPLLLPSRLNIPDSVTVFAVMSRTGGNPYSYLFSSTSSGVPSGYTYTSFLLKDSNGQFNTKIGNGSEVNISSASGIGTYQPATDVNKTFIISARVTRPGWAGGAAAVGDKAEYFLDGGSAIHEIDLSSLSYNTCTINQWRGWQWMALKEALIFDSSLSDSDFSQVSDYLANKWEPAAYTTPSY